MVPHEQYRTIHYKRSCHRATASVVPSVPHSQDRTSYYVLWAVTLGWLNQWLVREQLQNFCPSETRMHKFTDLLIKAGYDHSNHINEAIDSLSKQSNDVTIISSENEEMCLCSVPLYAASSLLTAVLLPPCSSLRAPPPPSNTSTSSTSSPLDLLPQMEYLTIISMKLVKLLTYYLLTWHHFALLIIQVSFMISWM